MSHADSAPAARESLSEPGQGAQLPDDVARVVLVSDECDDAIWQAASAAIEAFEEQGKFQRELLRDVLWSTGNYVMDDVLAALVGAPPSMGKLNLTDAICRVGDGLFAIAEAIRGGERPVQRVVHERAPKPEPGDDQAEVVKIDKRKKAS